MHKEDYKKFFTSTEFEHFLMSKGIDASNFQTNIFKVRIEDFSKHPIGTYVKENSNGDILFLKELIENMDWDYFKYLQKTNTNSFYQFFAIRHFEERVPLSVVCHILDCKQSSLTSRIKRNNTIFSEVTRHSGKVFIKCADVDKWLEFKKAHIEIREICENIINKIEKKDLAKDRFFVRKIFEMYENGLLDEFGPVLGENTPFTSKAHTIFVKRKFKDEVYKQLQSELTYKTISIFGSKKDKFNFKLEKVLKEDNFRNKKNKSIIREFSNFATTRLSNNQSSRQKTYCDILDLIVGLDKELKSYTTDEAVTLLNSLPSNRAKEEFDYFLKHLRSITTTAFGVINFDRKKAQKEPPKPIEPYTDEQYQRFGFLVLSDSHIWYEEYMKKALEKRAYSGAWLYAVLHFVCAWRHGDILNKLPRADLRMKPEEFLDKVKEKKLTKEDALDIVEQVNMRLHLWNLKPSKTKSPTSPNLVMEIPESLFVLIGTLIGILEAQFQLSHIHNKKTLISQSASLRKTQVEFFGEEFVEIFGEDAFNNLRAVKNYETLMCRKADETELGTGYMIASIARAHKFKLDKKATTTMVYLEYYKNMGDSKILLHELFERGVCSFVPYLLTKIVAGEEKMLELSFPEKSKKVKEIVDVNPHDSEMLIQGYYSALEKAEGQINEILRDASLNGLDPKKIATDILSKIVYNEASSKQGNLPCMLMAQGKPCIYKKRENCIGCGHEIYLKSCLFELGNRIAQAKEEASISKTVASRNKNILLIKDVLSPIVAEVFTTLKDVYKLENLDEFKRLIR